MKIFVSTAFSKYLLPDGSVEPGYRQSLEKIIKAIEAKGHQAWCALQIDGWHVNDRAIGEAFLMDANGVKDCDLMIVLAPNNPPSAGVEFELGIGYALNKPVLLFWQANDIPVQYMNQGLLTLKNVQGQAYERLSDIPELLEHLLATG